MSRSMSDVIVYGPYGRKDGRKHVIYYNKSTQARRTQSYPRFLMEQFLGRELEDWEQVDHKDDDCTNNEIGNFQLLTRIENTKKSCKPAEVYQFICPICKKWSEKRASNVRHNRKQGKAGPFCSKRCAGKYRPVNSP